MIIWSGFGFIVPLVAFVACFFFQTVTDAQFGEGYYSSNSWPVGLALIFGGAISSVAGFGLKSSGIDVSQHSFFFIPIHWAGASIAICGMGVAAYDLAF